MITLLLPTLLILSTPQIILDHPTIRGSMPREMAQSSIKKRLKSIKACYQNAPSPLPKKITARLVVGPDGRVKLVKFEPSSKKHQALKACLKKELQLLLFPRTCSGMTMIDQPIRLRPPPKKKPPKPHPKPDPPPLSVENNACFIRPLWIRGCWFAMGQSKHSPQNETTLYLSANPTQSF